MKWWVVLLGNRSCASEIAVSHCARMDMFCAQKGGDSASVLPNSLGKLVFLTHRNCTSFHSAHEQDRETLGAGASPAKFHRCSRDPQVGWGHPGPASQRPEVGMGYRVWRGKLCLQVCWAEWIPGGGPGAMPKSLVTRSAERNKNCARV